MINNQLAKKLKDAGFPQMHIITDFDEDKTIIGGEGQPKMTEKELLYIPTLSELIEACGKEFEMLLKDCFLIWDEKKKVYADYVGSFAGLSESGADGSNIYDEHNPHGFGKTPEEAVANLWLKLNEK